MGDNSFHTTVESLFKGMDSFITTKTVVGDAIHIGVPYFTIGWCFLWRGSRSVSQEKKNNGAGGMGWKDHTERCVSDPEWNNQACQHQKSGWTYESAGYGAGLCEQIHIKR